MTLRTLTNECVDGWSYTSDMVHWYSADMSGDITYIEKPELRASSVLKSKDIVLKEGEETLEDNLISITTKEEIGEGSITAAMAALDAAKNNIITVDASLAGDTITLTSPITLGNNTMNLQFNGNGIVVKGSASAINILFSGKNAKYENAHFMGCTQIGIKNGNKTDNILAFTYCTFTGGTENLKTPLIFDKEGSVDSCQFTGCRFSDVLYQGKMNITSGVILSLLYCKFSFISCTFVNNTVSDSNTHLLDESGTNISTLDKIQLVNCVSTEDNKNVTEGYFACPNSIASGGESTFEYNVIEGNVYDQDNYEDITLSGTNTQGDDLGNIVAWDDTKNEYVVAEESKAIAHFPTNTTIEGVTMPEKDILGNAIDYTQATQSGACQTIASALPPVSIDENLQTGKISIDNRTLSIQGYEGYDFSLFNTCGQRLQSVHADSEQFTVNIGFQPGIYLLKGTNGKEQVSVKLILNK